MKKTQNIVLILAVMLLLSCSPSARKSGSLSEAMDKASDDYQGERKVEAVTEEENEPEYERGDSFIVFKDSANHKEDEQKVLKDLWLGVQFGTGIMSTESFYGISSFSIIGNQFYGERKSFNLEFGGSYSPLQTTENAEFDPNEDEITKALDGGIFSLYAGIKLRYYTTPKKTFLGNYFGFGAGVQSMFWTYKNALEIDEYDENDNITGTETIKSDQLWGFDVNCVAALNYIQTKWFILGIEFNPGIIIWGPETHEGFSNDVFLPFLYFKTNFNFMINGK